MQARMLKRDHLTHRSTPSTARSSNLEDRGGLFRRWLKAAARQWQRRKMIAALRAMDERLLRDIGIERDDISRVVDGLSDRELSMVPVAPSEDPDQSDGAILRKAA